MSRFDAPRGVLVALLLVLAPLAVPAAAWAQAEAEGSADDVTADEGPVTDVAADDVAADDVVADDVAADDVAADDVAEGEPPVLAPPEDRAEHGVLSTDSSELPPALFADLPEEEEEETEVSAELVHERRVVSSSPRTLLGERAAVWMEVGGSQGGGPGAEAGVLSTELGMRYRVADYLVADVSFGLTYAATDVRGEIVLGGMPTPYEASIGRLEPGNPTLGGSFVHRTDGLLLEVGLSLSIPTAARDDSGRDAETAAQRASSEVALRAPMAMRGYRGAFRWAPERFGMAVPFRVVVPVAPIFVEIDGALAVLLPVLGDRVADADTLIDLGVGVGAEVAGPLRLGVRLGGVGAATGGLLPGFTLSVEPWLGLRFAPVNITARGVLNLSGDDGVGGSRGPGFGVLVGAGVEI